MPLIKKSLSDVQFGLALLIPLIFFVLALNIYPLGYSIWMSLTDYDISRGTKNFIGFRNYGEVFLGDPYFTRALGVTLRFTAEAVIMNILLGLGMALLLNEVFRGRGVMRMIALLPWSMSTYAVATLFRYLTSPDVGLLSAAAQYLGLSRGPVTFLSAANAIDWVALAFSWNLAPLGAFFFLANLQVIPEDLYRQAKTDGAGAIRRFRHVTLPYLRYSLLVVLLLVTLFAATETTLIITFTGGGPGMSTHTLTYWVYVQTFTNYAFGYGSALSWILMVIILSIGIVYFVVLTRRRGG